MPHEEAAVYAHDPKNCDDVLYIQQYDAHFCFDHFEWVEEKCTDFCVYCHRRPRTPKEITRSHAKETGESIGKGT